jgi:hypothetical protein
LFLFSLKIDLLPSGRTQLEEVWERVAERNIFEFKWEKRR